MDAGRDSPHGLLPVDERNPIILNNDNLDDNYQAIYALLFGNAGSPPLAGIVINDSAYVADTNKSISDWKALVSAARQSGMLTGARSIPDPILSVIPTLVRPSDGNIDATQFAPSPGARFIVDTSARLALPYRPVVLVTGTRLTEAALAYLMDHTVVDRLVVVSAVGTISGSKGVMGAPNGDLDAWADWIVANKFRYVQVGPRYDQTADVTAAQLGSLPKNPFCDSIATLQGIVEGLADRPDQISLLAVALPKFAVSVTRVAPDPAATFSTSAGPSLVPTANGQGWLVTGINPEVARVRLWDLLNDPMTFGK
jgi:hypothetical protein